MTVIKCDKCKKEIRKGMRMSVTFARFETEETTTSFEGFNKNFGNTWELCNECYERLLRELPTL